MDMTKVAQDDAGHLEHHWGVAVAMEMLHEGSISPKQFLSLCAEAAEAVAEADDIRRPAPSHRRERSRSCALKRERRDRRVALSTM